MSDIVLSREQKLAADAVAAWLKKRDFSNKPYFILHGFGGTGKSTVASYLAEQHNGPIYYLAYTGAAAQILRAKGLPCKTIHSSIYVSVGERIDEARKLQAELEIAQSENDDRKIRKLSREIAQLLSPEFMLRPTCPFDRNGLIVLDECSFVAEKEARDLLSYNIPILVLGDPGQLPPVEGKGFFNKKPDFILTQIHRQAAGSPIIQLAAMAREGKPMRFGQYGNCSIIRRRELTDDMLRDVEQVIVGKNTTRVEFNNKIRTLRGFSGVFPKANERLMCLRNNSEKAIYNGEIFITDADADFNEKYAEVSLHDKGTLYVHKECFTDPEILKTWEYEKRKKAQEFTYGYAITAHKAQGGAFKSVIIIADMYRWPNAYEDLKRWTYTALTRAQEQVTLVWA